MGIDLIRPRFSATAVGFVCSSFINWRQICPQGRRDHCVIARAGLYALSVPELSMSARSSRVIARFVPAIATAVCISFIGGATATGAGGGDPIAVVVDQATLIKLPDRVAALVVGNPLIADVSLQPGSTMVVTGRSYGSTNVMAIDRTGTVLVDRMIQVDGPTDKLVTVFRGINRETYSCTPVCQKRITLGDGADYFKSTLEQTGTLTSQAAGSAADKQ
jgi:Pilus formation protein N terminal region